MVCTHCTGSLPYGVHMQYLVLLCCFVQVQIVRGADCQSISMDGLYPCGEGAGYAGGIVSSAVDGLRVGAAVVEALVGVRY